MNRKRTFIAIVVAALVPGAAHAGLVHFSDQELAEATAGFKACTAELGRAKGVVSRLTDENNLMSGLFADLQQQTQACSALLVERDAEVGTSFRESRRLRDENARLVAENDRLRRAGARAAESPASCTDISMERDLLFDELVKISAELADLSQAGRSAVGKSIQMRNRR